MKAYKGFNKDMTCRGFQYEVGKTYETDEADLCNSGFHACKNPLDCFKYYSPAKSKYCAVEIEDNGQRHTDDSKVVGKKIKIVAELSVAQICKIHFDYVKKRCIPAKSTAAGDRESAFAGHSGNASAGRSGSASAGDGGNASAGKYGNAFAGNCGNASAGMYGNASAGKYGNAFAGNCGNASAGERGSAFAGDGGNASAGRGGVSASRGSADVGGNGVAVVRGYDVKVKGGIGSVLVVVIEDENDGNIKEWKAAVVDGERIRPDTWYTVENGEFREAD